ncbi:MAG: methyltransferase domain-containing protein [Bacteroidetes bacterium]|nr:methyltransferase domain-containing protein [Bacteroidota bacterium]HET6244184.1 methyltransferase domain-containing protein [Bacteroidia bacterium]
MVEGIYLHGYSEKEQQRLVQQALFLEQMVYSEIDLSSAKNLLEIGSGVGAQSAILLNKFPAIHITGIDSSTTQLQTAKHYLDQNPGFKGRFDLQQMNAECMDFEDATFDSVFLCWILEHVNNPGKVLKEAFRVLKPGGVLIASEVFNATFYTFPFSPNIEEFWNQYNLFQEKAGGDPNVGAKLGNLLASAEFSSITTKTKYFHADNRDIKYKRKTIEYWTELLLSAAPNLLNAGLVSHKTTEEVKKEFAFIADNSQGVFFCSFIQAQAVKKVES